MPVIVRNQKVAPESLQEAPIAVEETAVPAETIGDQKYLGRMESAPKVIVDHTPCDLTRDEMRTHPVRVEIEVGGVKEPQVYYFAPPEGGWNIPERDQVESCSHLNRSFSHRYTLGDWIELMIEKRGFLPSSLPAVLHRVAEGGWWGNWGGLISYSADINTEDCPHEYYVRGTDCRRYE